MKEMDTSMYLTHVIGAEDNVPTRWVVMGTILVLTVGVHGVALPLNTTEVL